MCVGVSETSADMGRSFVSTETTRALSLRQLRYFIFLKTMIANMHATGAAQTTAATANRFILERMSAAMPAIGTAQMDAATISSFFILFPPFYMRAVARGFFYILQSCTK